MSLQIPAILGRKVGMTQIFDSQGRRLGVTVINTSGCVISQVKTVANDGYSALQLGLGDRKEKQTIKPVKGHFAKANTTAKRYVREMRLSLPESPESPFTAGTTLTLEAFKANELVDVCGVSKGKGFAGVVKRYHFKGHPASHGTHEYFRHPGSIGCRFPQGTHKGKRFPGHMGVDNVTVQNLEIAAIKPEENLLMVKGAVPGAKGAFVLVRKAIKV